VAIAFKLLNVVIQNFMTCIHTQYCADDKIEKTELGRACSSVGGGKRHVLGFGKEA
jgi:hypothetical protein